MNITDTPDIGNSAKTVLAVDDDLLLLEIMRAKLEESGYVVLTAADGLDAVTSLGTHAVNLIITDIEMPNLDGFGLIDYVTHNAALKHIPIVVVTGVSGSDACDRAFAAGATAFVTKPINWTLLSYQVNFVLRNAEREAQIRLAHAAEEKANALKDHLLKASSHELKTPINAIIGFARIVKDELHGAVGAQAYLDCATEIISAGERLNILVGDLLLASKLLAHDAEFEEGEFDAVELLQSVVRDLGESISQCQANVQIHANSDDIFEVCCDSGLFKSAFRHLLRNALQYSPSCSQIDIVILRRDTRSTIVVSDQGSGISKSQLATVIMPFVQGDDGLTRASTGLGLGLAIADEIARLHGGTLNLKNQPTGGLSASIDFPTADTQITRQFGLESRYDTAIR